MRRIRMNTPGYRRRRQCLICVFALLGALLTSCAHITGDARAASAGAEHWKGVLALVHVGMRRQAVEEILGKFDFADIDADPEINARLGRDDTHRGLYELDAKWCAAITYDWTGFSEKNNPYGVLHEYEQRVVAPAELLTRRDALLLQRRWDDANKAH